MYQRKIKNRKKKQICSREMLLGCIRIGISWWLTSNCMVSRAINDKFDSWWLVVPLVKFLVNCTRSHAITSTNCYCRIQFVAISKAFMPGRISKCPWYRGSQRMSSVKKVFLKTSLNWQENTCARVSFLIKLQASGQQLH